MSWAADQALQRQVDVDALEPENAAIRRTKQRARIVAVVQFSLIFLILFLSIPLYSKHAAFGWLLLLQLPHLGGTLIAVLGSSRAIGSGCLLFSLTLRSIATAADLVSVGVRIGFLATCHLSCSSGVIKAFSLVVLLLITLLVCLDVHQLIGLVLMYLCLERRAQRALRKAQRIRRGHSQPLRPHLPREARLTVTPPTRKKEIFSRLITPTTCTSAPVLAVTTTDFQYA